MLKDLFNSNIDADFQRRISNFLDRIPEEYRFFTYEQAKNYYVHFPKWDGKYYYSIFLYNGVYYVCPKICYQSFEKLVAKSYKSS